MKLKTINTLLALAAFSTLNSQLSTLHAQGSLTPPVGAPAPIMKSLDQIEARTPMVAGQPGVSVSGNGKITISQPGSYYLTANLKITSADNGISVGTNSVTLDLNGFRIQGTNGFDTTDAGIFLSGVAGQTVVIRNGHISGGGNKFGFYRGIMANQNDGSILVENVSVSLVAQGFLLQRGEGRSVVVNCTVNSCDAIGIYADVVKRCTVRNTLSDGISASVVSDCSVEQSSGTGNGITGTVVQNSVGISVGGTGIVAELANNCYAGSISGPAGMTVTGTASFCRAYRSGGTSINAGIAIGCSGPNGTIVSAQKHLGTP